jgi:hypothetical protein
MVSLGAGTPCGSGRVLFWYQVLEKGSDTKIYFFLIFFFPRGLRFKILKKSFFGINTVSISGSQKTEGSNMTHVCWNLT